MNTSSGYEQLKAGLKAFYKLIKLWEISAYESSKILGSSSNAEYERWMKGDINEGDPSDELLDRLSLILGVYKILAQIHTLENQKLFLRNLSKDALFNKKTPIEFMMGSYNEISLVRNYLQTRII